TVTRETALRQNGPNVAVEIHWSRLRFRRKRQSASKNKNNAEGQGLHHWRSKSVGQAGDFQYRPAVRRETTRYVLLRALQDERGRRAARLSLERRRPTTARGFYRQLQCVIFQFINPELRDRLARIELMRRVDRCRRL